ncbi:hypothetical protein [Pedobacter ginsengiterrae]
MKKQKNIIAQKGRRNQQYFKGLRFKIRALLKTFPAICQNSGPGKNNKN